ncbi:MAG: XrtA system polysaccharide deacetylase [Candidatus Omnitrophota bacterium]
MINALTVDLEEWYHISGIDEFLKNIDLNKFANRVLNNTIKLLDIFSQNKVKATFFVLGSIAERFPRLIRRIDEEGHEVATHGFHHTPIYSQSRDDFSRELKDAINLLSDIIGKEIYGFRAPDFSITSKTMWAIDVLIQQGIRYDCSIFPIKHPRYGIPTAPRFAYKIKAGLIEFPPSTIRILNFNFPVAGGAYLRILPYNIMKGAIRHLNKKNKPANIYIHPWEIDPEQPRIKMPIARHFMHYSNLYSTEKKIRSLLKTFKFAPVKEVLGIV